MLSVAIYIHNDNQHRAKQNWSIDIPIDNRINGERKRKVGICNDRENQTRIPHTHPPSQLLHYALGANLGLPGGLEVLTACPKLIG